MGRRIEESPTDGLETSEAVMDTQIPKGWDQIRGTTVKRGDRIRTDEGWADAEDLLRRKGSRDPDRRNDSFLMENEYGESK
jgi:hypothetical protein